MKISNKFMRLSLTTAILMGMMTTMSFAEENVLDPFNNNLFSVVKEINFDMGDNYYLPNNMVEYDYKPNEDFSARKLIKIEYNENGEKLITDVTGYLSGEEFMQKYREYTAKDKFNDGLKAVDRDDFMGYDYFDVNGNDVCSGLVGQGAFSGYNIGIFRNAYGDMDMDTSLYDNFTTTFKNVMTDNAEYKFRAAFTNFSDKGYAIMEKDDKYYIVKLKNGIIPTVFYNGEKIKFDQIPVIENGRTLVPLRAIFEKIGASVDWNESTRTVTATKDGVTVALTINNITATKNGQAITLDVPAKIIGGRTLVPVRFISDCFGVKVEWDGVMKKVSLTK